MQELHDLSYCNPFLPIQIKMTTRRQRLPKEICWTSQPTHCIRGLKSRLRPLSTPGQSSTWLVGAAHKASSSVIVVGSLSPFRGLYVAFFCQYGLMLLMCTFFGTLCLLYASIETRASDTILTISYGFRHRGTNFLEIFLESSPLSVFFVRACAPLV